MPFAKASRPTKAGSSGTATLSPNSASPFRVCSMRSAKASPMATSRTPGAPFRASEAAPVPRPPQPMRPILISSLPAACTAGTRKAPTARVAPPSFRKLRRVFAVSFASSLIVSSSSVSSRALAGHAGAQSLQALVLLDGTREAEPDERRVGVEPDALGPLGVAAAPRLVGKATGRAGHGLRLVIEGAPAHDVRVARGVRVGPLAAQHPLPHVAQHVEKAPRVRLLPVDRMRLVVRVVRG